MLKVWNISEDNKNLKLIKKYHLSSYARSLDIKDGKILAGLRMGEIWTLKSNEEVDDIQCHMVCHSMGETWGLSVDSLGNVLTTGDDNKFLYFESQKNEVTQATEILCAEKI